MILDDELGQDGDALYARLMAAHDGLTNEQSHALNARLVLIMMNEIGDPDRVDALIDEARSFSSG